jgi:hypothetical protein
MSIFQRSKARSQRYFKNAREFIKMKLKEDFKKLSDVLLDVFRKKPSSSMTGKQR